MLGGVSAFALGVGLGVYEKFAVYDPALHKVPVDVVTANRAVDFTSGLTVICGVGLAVAITGVVLWKTSTRVVTVHPAYSHEGAGVTLDGRF